MRKSKVYINGRLVGFHDKPHDLIKELRGARRGGRIESQVNIAYRDDTNEVYINSDAGRVQRPLIIVENGTPKLTKEIVEKVKSKELSFNDLVEKGIIEFLDSEEEENTLIALDEKEVGTQHTHMEIHGAGIFSVMTSMIPFVEFNMAGKALHGAKMFKQAAGIPAVNYNLRTDTESFMLYYPQKSMVRTKTMDLIKLDERPQIQNFLVAIMPFYGINTFDAIIINKGAVDRALGRMSYFRSYDTIQNRYPGGQKDIFEIPVEETTGYLGEEAYRHLGQEGLAEIERFIKNREVIVGKTSPPRFLEEISEFGVIKEKRRDASSTIRKNKDGYVDTIFVTEDIEGNKLIKVKVRSLMLPEVGDKFSSRHGQKGVVGLIAKEEDMPFNSQGMRPDLILNPHSIPSRMTIGHLLEMLAGKAGSLRGSPVNATPFEEEPRENLEKTLIQHGLRPDGKETFYDGITGKRIEGAVFMGVNSYRRLYHVAGHKMQARSRGPVQILTRQPTEGKEKEGGLRFGEMEGETLVGHGAAMLLYEKLIEDSDKVVQLVCEKCGGLALEDKIKNKRHCNVCNSSKVYPVEMSYGFKLLLDEMKALGINPILKLADKV